MQLNRAIETLEETEARRSRDRMRTQETRAIERQEKKSTEECESAGNTEKPCNGTPSKLERLWCHHYDNNLDWPEGFGV